ncbi:SigB/SigF/SigG family RNA polymerase sigma factor [Nocardia jejuensis]|uniref:SigB/SigF/SigG family RNA polymerase sigma factor n=1 Tax=Nocardia jejuensis TaxID=328049 RepID=UPI00082E8A54|nr:SigB/SigF/SigG family RNA polymerase sigma factor [Nocardia jejuensis]
MTDQNTLTASRTNTHRRRGSDPYDGIEPSLVELATLSVGTPEHARLRSEILRRCLPLADHIARRYSGRGQYHDDLFQVASVGLIAAVDRFDPHRGTPFLGFAVPTMMGEVRRHFRDHAWAVRVPRRTKEIQASLSPAIERLCQRNSRMPTAVEIAVELEVDLLEVTRAMLAANAYDCHSLDTSARENDENYTPSAAAALGDVDPGYQLSEESITVGPLLDELTERERRVLHLRFYEGMTQHEIAEQLGVSQMQVSRILTKTLTDLRERALADAN